MSKWLERNPSTLVLARRELVSLQLSGETCRVACMAGRLWVTVSGSGKDSVLIAGDAATFTGRGKIVIEALRTATVRVEIPTAESEMARAMSTLSGPVTRLSA